MSLQELDPLLSTPKKLAALGMLVSSKEVQFTFIRDHLELSDSDLSKQMAALVAAGYVKVRKVGRGPSSKTWYRATRKGRTALGSHMAALNNLVLASLPPPSPESSTSSRDGVEQAT